MLDAEIKMLKKERKKNASYKPAITPEDLYKVGKRPTLRTHQLFSIC